ncbi:cancer/testis antigen 55-like [Mesocricetus auratus]|uniref:Cancer/testis antigen 55-like n=1 Tax=Mesocricetus auratus TaxID=10036 RepID=A0ABM2XHT3_MESAU|nr:cancer/testis antigen 55-like [Mesocricetus auratus]
MGILPSWPVCCYRRGWSDCGYHRLYRVLRNVVYFFLQKTEAIVRNQLHEEGDPNTKIVKATVTSCDSECGWIENCVFFSSDVVIGHMPLRAGDEVLAFVEEDPLSLQLKATQVCFIYEDDKPRKPGSKIRDISVCVSQVKKDFIYIADEYYFYLDSISKAILGFTPYEGDWLDIEYSPRKGLPSILVHSLKATLRRYLQEVLVTHVHKGKGVLDHTIFFTLESLKLPEGYTPLVGHVVSVVIVQSIRPNYNWRAISMTPTRGDLAKHPAQLQLECDLQDTGSIV